MSASKRCLGSDWAARRRDGSSAQRPVRPQKRENPLWERVSKKAADRIRTDDLLHGKQTL